jgi:uncharacterized integral membrane protein (TIGR00698 family)
MMISKQTLLRAGIILYGLRLSFTTFNSLAARHSLLTRSSWHNVRYRFISRKKVFALDDKLTVLIGAGSSVCGAAAIMATSPVIKGKSDDASIAISGVMIFGTSAC